MSSFAPLFEQAAGYADFAPAMRAMAAMMHEQAAISGHWEADTAHPYNSSEHNRGFVPGLHTLYRSDQGLYGIVVKRPLEYAQSDMLAARLALHARIPLSPVFAFDKTAVPIAPGANVRTISLIAFNRIVHNPRQINLQDTADYLRHRSYIQPFLFLLGHRSDRSHRNICVDADNVAHHAEFDFAITGLLTLLDKLSDAALYTSDPRAIMPSPLLRAPFAAGVSALRGMPDDAARHALDLIDTVFPVTPAVKDSIEAYIATRRDWVLQSFDEGDFDACLTDACDARPTLRTQDHGPHVFTFT
jgi:hypothetical protein